MICEDEGDDEDSNRGVLDLSMRGWRSLDASLLRPRARVVQLEHNTLASLPSSIGTLTLMVTLDVSHNVLDALPAELGECTRLVTLKCDNNHIRELPKELSECRHLEAVYANCNRLTTIPESLGTLEMLRVIELRSNKLETIPFQIGGLQTLRVLDCAGNAGLTAIPASLRDDPHMVDFAVKLHYRTMRHYLDIRQEYSVLQDRLLDSEEKNMRIRDAIEVVKREKAKALSSAAAISCTLM